MRLFTAGIVIRGDKMLVLKRSADDDTYPGLWDCVGGHFEKGESAEECMLRETREESGLVPSIEKAGRLVEYRDEYGRSVAVPFLLESRSGKVELSEHTEFRWVSVGEARRLKTVPCLRPVIDDFRL